MKNVCEAEKTSFRSNSSLEVFLRTLQLHIQFPARRWRFCRFAAFCSRPLRCIFVFINDSTAREFMFCCSIVTVCRRTENLCFLHSEFLSCLEKCLFVVWKCLSLLIARLFIPRNCSRDFFLPSLFRYQKFVNLLWTCSKLYRTSYLMFDHIYHGKIERQTFLIHLSILRRRGRKKTFEFEKLKARKKRAIK